MTTNQDTKICVHCKSEINKMASKCPHCGGKNYVWTFTRKLLLAFILFMIFIVTLSSSIRSNVSTSDSTPTPTQVQVSKVFDLNSLYGKNIDQIINVLGKPESNTEPTSIQKQSGVIEWEKSFKKDGQTLLITYNSSTRKVIDFFIGTTDPSGNTKDVSSIITIAGNPSSDKFKTKLVSTIRDKNSYTGVIFVPNK